MMMSRYPDRRFATRYERELRIVVDPVKARFSSWYEFFPRSAAAEARTPRDIRGLHRPAAVCRGDGISMFCICRPYIRSAQPSARARTTLLRPNPVMSAARGRSGLRRAATSPSTRSSARSDDFRKLIQSRVADLGIDIALDIAFQAVAGSSLRARASGMVSQASRRHHSVR